MKILHCADIHLGSKMTSFKKEVSEQRRNIIKTQFLELVQSAFNEGVKVILLSGDIFDSDSVSDKEVASFCDIVKRYENIDFLYLRGNHDINNSLKDRGINNLKTFNEDNWTTYEYDNITISGIEYSKKNKNNLYSKLKLDEDKINIVMLHGDINNKDINLDKLKNKNIDYLAMGHIHQHQEGEIDIRGRYVYPGCLVSRGFDETSEHGYVILDIDEDNLTYKFCPVTKYNIIEFNFDVTGLESDDAIAKRVIDTRKLERDGIYRINLTGKIKLGFSIDVDYIASYLEDECLCASVKNKTQKLIDPSIYENDFSIRGAFYHRVKDDNSLSEEEKTKILEIGISALEGKEFDL